jgi:hypothetical protein
MQKQLDSALPALKLSDDEKDYFVECIATGKPFQKEFVYGKGQSKFKVVLKDRTKKEGEIIGRALDREMNAGKILNWTEYNHLYNSACLYYQLERINGVEQVREYPTSVYAEFDLLSAIERASMSQWTNAQLYIAMGFVFQFNKAVLEISQEAFSDPNFS